MKLNRYATILRASDSPCKTIPQYDADGNLTVFGPWAFAYDAASRLVSVSSNGVPLVPNFYDAQSRRVRKATPEATATYFYDGGNLIEERVTHVNGTNTTVHYYWGKDISDSLQGAGGIGGLLYLTVDGEVYVPFYDNNGNVSHYLTADKLNVELVHEQLFYGDGGQPSNVGWSKVGNLENESLNGYVRRGREYDDCIMRLAQAEVAPDHYQLTWFGGKSKCNCLKGPARGSGGWRDVRAGRGVEARDEVLFDCAIRHRQKFGIIRLVGRVATLG